MSKELIRLRDLCMAFDDELVLDHINLYINDSEFLTLLGPSGCGKTTLIKLLQGFYQPNHGSIKVGNLPLTSINPHFWRSVTGSVMQESFIFSDTFAHNIALDSDSLDETRLYKAAKMANVDGFIRTLPLGYHTKIGMEGNGISQGQRQRLLGHQLCGSLCQPTAPSSAVPVPPSCSSRDLAHSPSSLRSRQP